jgi:hypothetical protein
MSQINFRKLFGILFTAFIVIIVIVFLLVSISQMASITTTIILVVVPLTTVSSYEHAGIPMPDWLKTRRLPQNQLESSFVDNRVAIKNAFETLINVNLKNFNKHDIFEESHIREAVSNRVANLLDGKKLPYLNRSRSDENRVIINTGILNELYKYGVTRDQLPNLKALADVMNGEYSRNENGMIIKVSMDQISNYFDKVEGDDK